MIKAAIELLETVPVKDLTLAMVAERSETSPGYAGRYFGSRDGFLAAVGEELGRRIVLSTDYGSGTPDTDAVNDWLLSSLTRTDLISWCRIWIHLEGSNIDPRVRMANRASMKVSEQNLMALVGISKSRARLLTVLGSLLSIGYYGAGSTLDIEEDEFIDVYVKTMVAAFSIEID